MSFEIEVSGGSSVRLPTAGKYCDRDIVVTATGGGGGDTEAAYNEGLADGKQAEYDRFWDAYQQNGNRADYTHGFGGSGWTADNFKPKYSMRPTNAYMMFRYCGAEVDLPALLEQQGITLDFSRCTTRTAPFFYSKFTRLGVIDLTASNAVIDCFSYCDKLVTIDKVIVREDHAYSAAFHNCVALKNITFEGTIGKSIDFATCTLLTKVSIESIIGHLSGAATGQTLTLSKTAVESAFGSTTATEWTSLVNTKSNWTISLV